MAREAEMFPRGDILPFLFPCGGCKLYTFHVVYEQPYGTGIKIPFTRRPLWSTGMAYQVVCGPCTMVNGRLEAADVNKLATNMLPKSIWTAYPAIHLLYSPGYYEKHRSELLGDSPDPGYAADCDR